MSSLGLRPTESNWGAEHNWLGAYAEFVAGGSPRYFFPFSSVPINV